MSVVQIGKKGKINFEGKELEVPHNQLRDFLLTSVSEQIALEEGVTLSELMNTFFHLKDFIRSYFIEEYDVLNAIISSGTVVDPISEVIVYKEMIISSEGDLMIVPKIRTTKSANLSEGYQNVTIRIDNKVVVHDESGFANKDKNIVSHMTLLELLGAVFEDFQDYITRSAGNH
jgi:hypothetical protein|tara:strand:- start:7155 stop:7676 length:522 start_codon:yes stop_codon:yes gene_type:complete